jgi:hypothetical protein
VLTTFFLSFLIFWVFRNPPRRAKQMEMHSARSREWIDLLSHFWTAQSEATTSQFTVTFQPGHSGTCWAIDGYVLSVADEGQACRVGVESGMKMVKINGRSFWETLRWVESKRDEHGNVTIPGYYEDGTDGLESYQKEPYEITYEKTTPSKRIGFFKAIDRRIHEVSRFVKRLVWPVPDGINALKVLPPEINAEVTRYLGLADLAALSACAASTWKNFGGSPEVWGTLARDRAIDIHSSWTSDPREAFRCEYFRTDGQQLQRLSSEMFGVGGTGYAAALIEAAHVARGLMPSDGRQAWEVTCQTAERALQAHNPSNEEAAAAAIEFLQVVRHRREYVGAAELERLEDAYNSALQLQAFMDVAMEENLDDIESVSDQSEVSASSSSRVDGNGAMEVLVPLS